MVSVQKANGVSSNFQAVRTNSSRENRTGTNSAPTPIPPHDAQVRPGFDHLPIAYRSRDIAQALPVGKVGLRAIPSFRHATANALSTPGATVDDYQAWAVPREHTVYDLLRELIAPPMPAASDQDTHVQIIASHLARNQDDGAHQARHRWRFPTPALEPPAYCASLFRKPFQLETVR